MELLILIGLLALVAWRFGGRRYFHTSRATAALKALPACSPTHYIVGTDGAALAIDASARKIAFVDRRGVASTYGFRDIVSVEACKNGVTHTKTNRGSQLAGAAIGKMLFGNTGMLIGGQTGSTTASERVKHLSLKVYVRDVAQPVREICIYRGKAVELTNRSFIKCAQDLDEWYGRIRAAMARL